MKGEAAEFMACWRAWYEFQQEEQNDHQERFNKYKPTLFPAQDFDAEADAEALRAAMKGFGTSESEITEILARRSSDQRLQIQEKYQQIHGRDLLKDLNGELGGNFEKVILALMMPLSLLLAETVDQATDGVGTDETALIQIFCTRDDKSIEDIKNTFEEHCEKSLEKVLCKESSGEFEKMLMSILAACRSDDEDPASIAERLASDDTDEDAIRLALTGHSFPHLEKVFCEYLELTGEHLETLIQTKCKGDLQAAFRAIYWSAKDRPLYFAQCLKDAFAGIGTDDSILIRIFVSRCELDLGTIREKYEGISEKNLVEQIKDEVSGDYAQALLALLGEAPPASE